MRATMAMARKEKMNTIDSENPKELVDRLIKALKGVMPTRNLERLSARLTPPSRAATKRMRDILAKVPGNSVSEQCEKVGVARGTYYRWLNGLARPKGEYAARIAELTGHTIKEITGA
jgi:DNA invertase Pin-like site-specific DNA recombinase